MTDCEKLRALLTEFGVGFVEHHAPASSVFVCRAGQAKVSGSFDCFTRFNFTYAGEFSGITILSTDFRKEQH